MEQPEAIGFITEEDTKDTGTKMEQSTSKL